MKRMYFGDRRDLFKFDLLLDILEAIPGLERLTFVPMLTEDDDSREGQQISRDHGARRPALAAFLAESRRTPRRDLTALREFFSKSGVPYSPYKDDELFSPALREEYFASIPSESLTKALVFFDPDIGLEPSNPLQMRRGGPEKYLRYNEVTEVARRAGSSSVMVVYQHLQRNKRRIAGDIIEKGSKLSRALSLPSVGYVTDQDVVFFCASRNERLHEALIEELKRHESTHSLVAGRVCSDDDAPGDRQT